MRAARRPPLGPALQQRGAQCAVEESVRLVRAQHRDGLGDGLHLDLACLLAHLKLLVRPRALALEGREELLVGGERGLRVSEVFLGVGVRLVRLGKVLRLGVELLLRSLDLTLLRGLQVFVSLAVRRLILLGLSEVGLEGLLHLPQDAEDLSRLRRVGLLEGGGGVNVVLGGLDEGGGHPPLGGREHALQQRFVLPQLVLQRGSHAQRVAARHLQQGGVVLLEHGDSRLQGGDGLQQVLFLRIELRELLFTQRSGLVECGGVFRQLLLRACDLCLQAGAGGSEILNLGREV
mmetsp:Transcript_77309/g.234374  ORF Transcript_77309/g.234374 Transcript_77309/m.234374 type:complete len:291 (+) Transcript_77309:1049-1921(+)